MPRLSKEQRRELGDWINDLSHAHHYRATMLLELLFDLDAADEQIAALLQERDTLSAWKADVEAAHRRVMDESCDADERHCTCVPALRIQLSEVQRQNAALREALAPFVAECEAWDVIGPRMQDDEVPLIRSEKDHECDHARFTLGDLRRAKELYAAATRAVGREEQCK